MEEWGLQQNCFLCCLINLPVYIALVYSSGSGISMVMLQKYKRKWWNNRSFKAPPLVLIPRLPSRVCRGVQSYKINESLARVASASWYVGIDVFRNSGVDSELPCGTVGAWHVIWLLLEFNFWVKNCIQQSFLKRTELLCPFPGQAGEARLVMMTSLNREGKAFVLWCAFQSKLCFNVLK